MAEPATPPRKRLWLVDRLAGVAAQFQHRRDGYVYQQEGIGAPIPVTREERDGFLRDAARALLLHVAAFGLCMVAIWLLVRRVVPADDALAAGAIAFLGSVAAMLLHASYRWAALAPARALAGRRAIGPAGEPRLAGLTSYRTIFGTAAIFLIFGLLGDWPPVEKVVLGVLAVMAAVFMAMRKWRFERRLNPAQRAEVKADLAAERARARAEFAPGKALIVLLFGIVELAIFAAVGFLTISLVLTTAGSSLSDPDGWPFAIGFLLALPAAALATMPLEKLCKWLTGTTASAEFQFLMYLP